MSRSIYMSDERYLAALKRMRDLIASGHRFTSHDDDSPGSKSSACSWGLCSDDKEAWPDAQDHLWPDQFTDQGRVAPLYLERHQMCPLDTREKHTGNGCFYTCLHYAKRVRPTKERALGLYDNQTQPMTETLFKPFKKKGWTLETEHGVEHHNGDPYTDYYIKSPRLKGRGLWFNRSRLDDLTIPEMEAREEAHFVAERIERNEKTLADALAKALLSSPTATTVTLTVSLQP